MAEEKQPKFMVDVFDLVKKNEDLYKLVKKLRENIKFQERVILDKNKKIKQLETSLAESQQAIENSEMLKKRIKRKKRRRPPCSSHISHPRVSSLGKIK